MASIIFHLHINIIISDNQKFLCPKQLPNIDGEYYSIEDNNVVRLYEYIPGKIFCDVSPSPNLFYQAGVYLGKLDESLKVFSFQLN